jgi:hypothetical protein
VPNFVVRTCRCGYQTTLDRCPHCGTDLAREEELEAARCAALAAKKKAEEEPEAARRAVMEQLKPNWECAKCGEMLWSFESLSPNMKSAMWSCQYCGKKELVRANLSSASSSVERTAIPKAVQREVWRRDRGRCVECGSKENLEFDHLLPLSKGGANTVRNIQILCQECNRRKSDRVG